MLKSVSGGLSIESEGIPAEPIQVAPPTPAVPIPPSVEVQPARETLSTSEILQRIESGELTVDEALRLMKE